MHNSACRRVTIFGVSAGWAFILLLRNPASELRGLPYGKGASTSPLRKRVATRPTALLPKGNKRLLQVRGSLSHSVRLAGAVTIMRLAGNQRFRWFDDGSILT